MAGSIGEKVLNLMLIGRTGTGKSATGNTILGQLVFPESSTASSETKDVVNKFTRFNNFVVKVVDCSGLMDTDMNSGEDKTRAALNMATALGMCNGGVDAFIVVIRRARFTEEQRKSLEDLKKIFGDRYMDNLIVVTFGDHFKRDMEHEGRGDISFKECCSQESGAFKQLYDVFSDRFLLINNREKDPQKNETQRRDIIQLADSLRKLNGRYTSKSFEEAKAARDKLIVKENLPMLNENIQMKVGLLAADLLKLKEAPSEGERKTILQSLDDLKKEITEKDKGTGVLNHLLANVEQVKSSLHDVDQLHRLAEKMENIREEKSSWSRYGKIAAGLTVVAGIGTVAAVVALSVVAAPVVIGVATAGLLVSGASYVLGVSKTDKSYQQQQELSKSEKQLQAEIDVLDRMMTEAKQDMKKNMEDLLDLLLIGKTGHGKSSTGNSILGRKAFKASASYSSVTEDVTCGFADTDGYTVKVVDGPGLDYSYGNKTLAEEESVKHMMKALSMCDGAVDAFVLVIKFGCRFTREDINILEDLRSIFGHDYLRHTIVVVTGGDLFHDVMEEEEGMCSSFHDWCRQETGAFRDLFNECAGRFVLFNNREMDEAKKLVQRKDLIYLVEYLRRNHGRYTSEHFKAAKKVREKMILELQAPVLKESIQRQISLLTAEIEYLNKNPTESARKQMKKSIKDLRDEIEAQDKGFSQAEHLRKLVDTMEQNHDDVSRLHSLSQELENIRKAKLMWSLIGSSFTIAGGALGLLVPFVGAVVSVASVLSTAVGCMQIDSKEKEIQISRNIMEQRLKPQGGLQENKEVEQQERKKYD